MIKKRLRFLLSAMKPKLSRYIERLGVGIFEDREDILQNAFMKSYKNLNSFDPTLAFSSWIYRIAHNETMSFFRAKHARPQVVLSEESEVLITELQDDAADASLIAEARLSREELTKALETLQQNYRDALTLPFFFSKIVRMRKCPIFYGCGDGAHFNASLSRQAFPEECITSNLFIMNTNDAHTTNDRDPLAERVFEHIEEKNLKPRPRYEFVIQNYFFWALGALAVALGAFAFSAMLFRFENVESHSPVATHSSFFAFFIASAPFFW